MKRATRIAVVTSVVVLLLCVGAVFAQWGGQANFWQVPLGSWRLNCPANACSVSGDTVNLPGTSAKSQLTADSAGSATTGLINSGISFPIAANQNGSSIARSISPMDQAAVSPWRSTDPGRRQKSLTRPRSPQLHRR